MTEGRKVDEIWIKEIGWNNGAKGVGCGDRMKGRWIQSKTNSRGG